MCAVRQIQTSIDIVASPTQVWSVLTDFPAYPRWNPFITSIEGKPHPGAPLKVTIVPPGRRPVTFHPVVLTATPWHELRWRGRLLIPGLFDGEHAFRLELLSTAGCRLHHTERFSGLLVGLVGGSFLDATREGFEEMNRGLKRQAEEGWCD
jgi:hypothetical protein